MSVKVPELGVEIAENPLEKLIIETIKNSKDTILRMELQLELQKSGLKFLEEQVNRVTE